MPKTEGSESGRSDSTPTGSLVADDESSFPLESPMPPHPAPGNSLLENSTKSPALSGKAPLSSPLASNTPPTQDAVAAVAKEPSPTATTTLVAMENYPSNTADIAEFSAPNETVAGLFENFDEDEIDIQLENPDDNFASVTKFEDLNLPESLLRGLYNMNYRKPSKIQEKALPLLLHSPPTNMIAQSQSGTGKTAAFVLTMLCRVDPSLNAVQALCLANTRELAIQINTVVTTMASQTTIRSTVAVSAGPGGRSSGGRRGRDRPPVDAHVLIGTPGTVLDMASKQPGLFAKIRVFVLDEADSMLAAQNLGEQSSSIRELVLRETAQVKNTPPYTNAAPPPYAHAPQFLLFSATFGDRITLFADEFAPAANRLTLRREEVKVEAIRQFALRIPQQGHGSKLAQLARIYGLLTVGQSIVFVQRRETAYAVQTHMTQQGHSVAVLTSDEEPSVRDTTMADFRAGKNKVLVATNVLARGIDVPQINLVVNYDMPEIRGGRADHESYVHRIGRTGRFGRQGIAINFIDGDRAQRVQDEITRAFSMTVVDMPQDADEIERMLKKFKI